MSRSSLPRHTHRFARLRTSAEGGGGGTGGTGTEGGSGAGGTGGTGGTGDASKNDPAPGEEAVDASGKGLGFPAKTPVEQMNDKQAAAYWRNQSKVQQQIADQRKDYDQIKADAQKWREYDQSQQTPSQRAIEEAKLEAKKEVAGDSALASLRAILQTRGKDETEVNDLLQFVSPSSFLTADGKVDHQKVVTAADKLAPTGSQGGGYGQGRYEQPNQSRSAAGIAEAERRGFVKKS